MKFDSKTVSVLKNFSSISPSMIFHEGNVLKTISPNSTVIAKAQVPVSFDRKFAIKNVGTLLSALSFYEDPDVNFEEKNFTISKGNSKTVLSYTAESTIRAQPPENDPKLPTIDVTFNISASALANIMKMLSTLGLPEVAIVGDGTTLSVCALDSKNAKSETHSETVGTTDKKFKAIFKSENLKIVPGDYDIEVCSRGISHFKGKDIEYWIAVEQNSTYN